MLAPPPPPPIPKSDSPQHSSQMRKRDAVEHKQPFCGGVGEGAGFFGAKAGSRLSPVCRLFVHLEALQHLLCVRFQFPCHSIVGL